MTTNNQAIVLIQLSSTGILPSLPLLLYVSPPLIYAAFNFYPLPPSSPPPASSFPPRAPAGGTPGTKCSGTKGRGRWGSGEVERWHEVDEGGR